MSKIFLEGFEPEKKFADEAEVTVRTVRNWRNKTNGLPYARVGGTVYIPIEEGRAWLRSLIVKPNATR